MRQRTNSNRVNAAVKRLVKRYRRELELIAASRGSISLAEAKSRESRYVLLRFPVANLDPLSPQQRNVAVLVAQGMTIEGIAARLGIATATVSAHLRVVYRKLRVRSRYALETHLRSSAREHVRR